MTYNNAFSIDELVEDKKKFVNKRVPVNGELVGYSINSNFSRPHMILQIRGGGYKISTGCEIGSGDTNKIKSYLDAYLGEQVGLEISANSRLIRELKFGDDEFTVRR